MSKIIDALNEVKQAELTAILQFHAQAAALKNTGLEKLAEMFEKEAIEEFGHDEKLAERIYFLDGTPKNTPLADPKAKGDLKQMLKDDIAMEAAQIKRIKGVIAKCQKANDPGTVHLLTEILLDEEHHWAELGQMLDQLNQYGVGYLACVCGGGIPMASPLIQPEGK
jgi:bacterioferritin